MAIDFPNSPTNGQTYSVGDKMWTYNSADNKWLLSSVSPDSGTLTTKGDLLTRSSSAITRLGAGSNGDVLVADSGATEGLRWQGQANTGRNLVINGAMQVAQRGTSTTGITGDGYFTADRWTNIISSLGTWTQTVENDGPTGTGLRKSLKMLCTTADASPAAGDYCIFLQKLEGQDLQRILKGTSSAQQLTLSFWVKSNVTGTNIVELYDNDNARQVSASYTVSSSGTWEKKTITFPADTTGVIDNDNAYSLGCFFWLGAGSSWTSSTLNTTWNSVNNVNRAVGQTNLAAATNNYWQITGVQLEVGPVATGFDFEPYETTLRKCQRYYQKISQTATNFTMLMDSSAYNTTGVSFLFNKTCDFVKGPTSMETANIAVFRFSNSTYHSSGTWSYGANNGGSPVVIFYTHGSAVFTAGETLSLVTTSGTNPGYVALNAEL